MKSTGSNALVLHEFPRAMGGGSAHWTGADDLRHEQEAPRTVHLTQRQREVLDLLCEGMPNKLICRHLNIAPGTVKIHVSCILRELGVGSRLQAVVAARRYGLAGARSGETQ